MNPEGWFVDPFGRYEARWFSDGTPTALVRDGGVEAHDPPPDDPVPGALQRLPEAAASDGHDMKRADDAEGNEPPFDPAEGSRAAFDMMDRIGPHVYWHEKPHRRGRT
jgi:hypothetical protein